MLSKKFLIMSNNPKTTDSHCLETADTNGLPEVDYPAPPQGICCIGITGGIGSGKSYICAQLEAAGHQVFYCDDEAKKIIRTDPVVRQQLTDIVGPALYDHEGHLVKSVLAAYLCQGRSHAQRIDRVVHPRVAQAFANRAQTLAAEAVSKPLADGACLSQPFNAHAGSPVAIDVETLRKLPTSHTLFMECALLFEASFDRLVHHSVLVHVSTETQTARLMARDGISRAKAEEWMSLQLSETDKMARANAYICNE